MLRSNPGATSVIGGVVAGSFLLLVGGAHLDPVGVVLAVLLGAVFALGMYFGGRVVTRR